MESQVNLCVARTLMINNIHHIIYLTFNFEWYSVLIDINEPVHYLKKWKIKFAQMFAYIILHLVLPAADPLLPIMHISVK